MEINWNEGVFAISYGIGPFHPAIRNGNQVYYWPNTAFVSESEAYERACLTLADAIQPAADIVKGWNVSKA